ncbi:Transcription initiation factor TFIID subunit 1 [Phytophthora cinnamomi]|uniref:Transcription initiation factor TFIID subunit 1 n=1 Tax=Phytophthora cinnamomi TaxID=4785 RepID=UPI00355A6EB4|nr:Transcription initiation factor TFIID subunit 1 [Phytophthora cinnamomi]
MWGVGIALALVAGGVALIALGFQAQEAGRKAQAAALFKWVPKAGDGVVAANFLNASGFNYAMDAPEFTSFYLWNLTNAEDLLSGGAVQPELEQVGPYTYEKRTRKVNVNFHAIDDDAYDADSYSAVSYQVASTYHFSSERSNGSESDVVVTLNASYVRHLTKLHAQTGHSERFLAAEFAHAHIRDYTKHLQTDFLAATKLRALRALLPEMVVGVKREGMTAVINRQRKRIGDAGLPAALVRMHAVARTEQIPVMLRDVFRDQADVAIPGLLTKQYALARRQAVPRVLSNLYNRLLVEAVPALLGRQIEAQQVNFVPRTLGSLNLKLQRIAFPYVLQEVFERACFEVVPFILRSIKSEIVARNIATNRVTADDADLAVVNLWRQVGSTPTDFDAWIDDSPTGQARTGFELLPATSALQLSLEAATILLGSLPSNLRFSLVDYDANQTAADGLGGPQTTAVGFAIWKQVVALNETAIDYVLDGVNNDVALPFETAAVCEALMSTVIEAYDSEWSDQEKQQICVDRSGEAGVGVKTVYLQLPGLEVFVGNPVLFASPPSAADDSPATTPLWSNSTTTERGASTFDLVLPSEDSAALYRKSKSVVGRLLAVDNTTLMNAWGENVELSAVRVTDGSQFTTAVLTGQGENTANSVDFPPKNLYFYWGYARRVAEITFDTNTTRFGISLMRYGVDWTLPSRLPTGIVASTTAPTDPSLNMSFLNDDLPMVLQNSSSPDSPTSVLDVEPRTGAVLHRRLVWQLTARIGETSDRQVLDIWHRDLAAGWLPVVWIEEEAGISFAASTSMVNLGPLSAKTLFVLGVVGGSCAIAVGCVVAYVSIRRARLMRMQRFHAIVPEASAAAVEEEVLENACAEEDKGEIVDASAEVMQTMLDHTEGIDSEDAGGDADEIRTEETTRAWLHRAPEQ